MALASVISASLAAQHGQNTVTAMAVAILIGAAGGAFVGILVTRININSIISTVAMGSILTALANAISKQQDIIGLPNSFTKVGASQWFGIQTEVWIVFVIVIGLWFVLEHTPMGRQLFAVGGNIEAARLNGLRVDRLRIISLVIGSTCAAGAGVLATSAVTSGSSQIGPAYLLPAYAAAFLGATQIKPGRVNVWGTVLAVITLAVGVTGLQLLGAAEWVSDFFDGAALLGRGGIGEQRSDWVAPPHALAVVSWVTQPRYVAIPTGVEALDPRAPRQSPWLKSPQVNSLREISDISDYTTQPVRDAHCWANLRSPRHFILRFKQLSVPHMIGRCSRWCRPLPGAVLVGISSRDAELRSLLLRPRCTDGHRLHALGGFQYSR